MEMHNSKVETEGDKRDWRDCGDQWKCTQGKEEEYRPFA